MIKKLLLQLLLLIPIQANAETHSYIWQQEYNHWNMIVEDVNNGTISDGDWVSITSSVDTWQSWYYVDGSDFIAPTEMNYIYAVNGVISDMDNCNNTNREYYDTTWEGELPGTITLTTTFPTDTSMNCINSHITSWKTTSNWVGNAEYVVWQIPQGYSSYNTNYGPYPVAFTFGQYIGLSLNAYIPTLVSEYGENSYDENTGTLTITINVSYLEN